MDRKWKAEVKDMSVLDQWATLYDKKKDLGHTALWNSPNGFRGCNNLVVVLPKLLRHLGVKSFIDVGCSNRYWSSTLDWDGIKYTGYDIVKGIIEKNKVSFPNDQYYHKNLIEDKCGKADMVFSRSVLIHTSLKDCQKIIENIKASGSKYMMISTVPMVEVNHDTSCIWKVARNLEIEPFNMPAPMMLIPEMQGAEKNNYMGIWEI